MLPFSPSEREFVLTVQVSNHEYRSGGLWREIQLGTAASLEQQRFTDVLVTFILAAVMLTTSLNALFYYDFRKSRLVYLLFAFFAFIIGLRYLATGDYAILSIFPNLAYEVLIRVEYASIGILYITAILFFTSFLGGPRRLLAVLIGPELVFLALAPGAPIVILSRSLFPIVCLMGPQLALFIARVWWPAWREGTSNSMTILAGMLLVLTAGIHDLLVTFNRYILISFVPWAFFLFVLLNAAMLAGHFNSEQRRLDTMITDLSMLLLDKFTGIVIFADHLGIVIKASEAASRIFGDNLKNKPLHHVLKGCSGFEEQWNAMRRDLQPRNELMGFLGAGRYKIQLMPYQSSDAFVGAIVRIIPESTLDESAILCKFTSREREIAELICKGLDTKQIGKALCISTATVKNHLHNLYTKTGTSSRSALLRTLLIK